MAQPQVKETLVKQGSVLMPLAPKALASYMTADTQRWKDVAAAIRYQPVGGKAS